MPHSDDLVPDDAEHGLLKEPDVEGRLDRVEGVLGLLLSDEAVGNVLKGPLRLPLAGLPAHVLATTGSHTGSLPWSDLDKTGSSLADLATRAHANLSDAPAGAHHDAFVQADADLLYDVLGGLATHAGIAAAHHAVYLDSDAIAAVEGEATLDLLGQVTMAQDVDVLGHMAIGAGASVDATRFLNIVETIVDDSIRGINVEVLQTTSSAGFHDNYGLFFRGTIQHGATNYWQSSLFGILGQARVTMNTAGDFVNNVAAVQGKVNNQGAVGNSESGIRGITACFWADVTLSALRVDEMYFFFVDTPSGSGKIGDAAGLRINDLTSLGDVNTDDYSIWSIGASPMTHVGAALLGADARPATSAILELQSTVGALLLPRMTDAQEGALTPVNGMVIYNSEVDEFHFYENEAWVSGSGLA